MGSPKTCISSYDTIDCAGVYFGILRSNYYPVNSNATKYLDLDNTGLKSLDGHVFYQITSLRILILRNNHLRSLHNELFSKLTTLERLDLTNNSLVSLSSTVLFRSQGLLKELLLSFNKLIFIDARALTPLKSLEELNLFQNPFVCDCKLRFTMMWCKLRDLDTKALCHEPFLFSGLSWYVLESSETCTELEIIDSFTEMNDYIPRNIHYSSLYFHLMFLRNQIILYFETYHCSANQDFQVQRRHGNAFNKVILKVRCEKNFFYEYDMKSHKLTAAVASSEINSTEYSVFQKYVAFSIEEKAYIIEVYFHTGVKDDDGNWNYNITKCEQQFFHNFLIISLRNIFVEISLIW
ncbi:hypothetical protein ANN_12842 [Periplaneta americana]|uniref:Uncharacterized protein n=1 Tax=Periplaneta americana TaxID=6978 RepID=A0ABQ8TJV1_PERAM|nr:hypothetical protein ANN_12842 [Periplaneta americana]